MSMTRCVATLALALLLGACDRHAPMDGLTDEEQFLVGKICRDRYVVLKRTFREADGYVKVWTEQAGHLIVYKLAPAKPETETEDGGNDAAAAKLIIHRVPDHTPTDAGVEAASGRGQAPDRLEDSSQRSVGKPGSSLKGPAS